MPMLAAPLIAALEQIGPHDHLCSIYETQEEQFAFAIPFIRTGLDHWWEYESKLTDMLCENNCFVLCQYNRRCFPPRFILDVIRTHPVVVYRGAVCRNFYHVPPDEFRSDNESEREVKALLTRMGERERVESELSDQQGELLLARSRLSDQQ